MPLSGTSQKVLDSMKEQYGDKKGESVFYATANKKGGKAEAAATWKKKKKKGDKQQKEAVLLKEGALVGYLDGYMAKNAFWGLGKKDPEKERQERIAKLKVKPDDPEATKFMTWLMAQKGDPKAGEKYFVDLLKKAPVDWKRLRLQPGWLEKQVAADMRKPEAVYAARWLARGTPYLPQTHIAEKTTNPYRSIRDFKRSKGWNLAFPTMLPALLAEIKKDPEYYNKMKTIMSPEKSVVKPEVGIAAPTK